jgi:hypothetical protein
MKSSLFSSTVSPLYRLLAVSALGLGLAACGSSVEPSETASAAAPAPAAQAVAPAAKVHTRTVGGPFFHALSSVTLRADQQVTVENLQATLAAQAAPVRAARAALGAEIAQQVRTGVMDEARTQPLIANIKTAVQAQRPAMQKAVQQLHDTLDATQRQAVVDALPTPGSHAGFAGHHAAMKTRMDKLATELGLTEEQRTAIHDQMRAQFAEHKAAWQAKQGEFEGKKTEMKAQRDAITTAFATDTFDAQGLGVGEHGGAMGHHFARMHGAFLKVAVPLLTPAQRGILATKIQSHMAQAATAVVNEPVEGTEAADAVEGVEE